MSENGVTAVFEALVDDEVVSSIAELDRCGELNMYYEGAVRFRGIDHLPDAIERLKRIDADHGNHHIRLNTLKLFRDGTLRTRRPQSGLTSSGLEVLQCDR